MSSVLSDIKTYQKKLDKYAKTGETEKLLYCIHKLKYLPVTVTHLEETGVGRTVNNLRHMHGLIGEKARVLVTKWKDMVSAEEDDVEEDEEISTSYRPLVSSTSHLLVKSESSEEENSEPDNCLQILESNNDDNDCSYNPLTSKQDYQRAKYPEHGSAQYSLTAMRSNARYEPDETQKMTTSEHVKSNKCSPRKHKKEKRKSDDSLESSKVREKEKKSHHKEKTRERHKIKKEEKEVRIKKEDIKEESRTEKDSRKSDRALMNGVIKDSQRNGNTWQNELPAIKLEPREHAVKLEHGEHTVKLEPRECKKERIKSEKNKHRNSESEEERTVMKKRKEKSSKSKNRESKRENGAEKEKGFSDLLIGFDSPLKMSKERKIMVESEEGNSKSKRGLVDPDHSFLSKKPKLIMETPLRSFMPIPMTGLNLDSALLPEISPNYRPFPRVPLRDDLPSSSHMTDEEALHGMFSSRNKGRSKVYSGKISGLSRVPSLFESCIQVLQENIDALDVTGGIPYEILKPVLERASPQQLTHLEYVNPYLLEDSDVLWESHCRRDFKNKTPGDMESWRDLYLRLGDERERKFQSLTENLHQKHAANAEPKRRTLLAFVNAPAKPPKGVARAQARYGTASAVSVTSLPNKAAEVAARKLAMHNSEQVDRPANGGPAASGGSRPAAVKKSKPAPLMAKCMKSYRTMKRR